MRPQIYALICIPGDTILTHETSSIAPYSIDLSNDAPKNHSVLPRIVVCTVFGVRLAVSEVRLE